MAIQSQPSRIPEPFAGSGTKNTIPATNATPSASQAASWASGFPPECSQPISAGGCPVPRNDMNGALNQLSQDFSFRQDGGVWAWSASADYDVSRVVRGSDGALYWSIAQSGPSLVAGAHDPVADDGTYWQQMPLNNANVVHITGDEKISGAKQFLDSISIGDGQGDTIVSLPIHAAFEFGNNPDVQSQMRVVMCDSISSLVDHRFGMFRTIVETNGDVTSRVDVYQNVVGGNNASIIVGATLSGETYATAPSTSELRVGGNDIVTRNWIPKDTRIIHSTENESISGVKTFNDNVKLTSVYGLSDEDQTTIGSGTSFGYDHGAKLTLNGSSYSSDPGSFSLHTGGTAHATLQGLPSGTLSWNGQPVQTSSDERLKTPLASVPDDVLDAWEAVGWGQFKYLDAVEQKGEAARLHLGLIAQRVKAVFEERGLDACAYGILCHVESPAADDEPANEIWMVRYTEALAMEAACQRRRADRAEARLAALEEKLAAIEAKLNAQP